MFSTVNKTREQTWTQSSPEWPAHTHTHHRSVLFTH